MASKRPKDTKEPETAPAAKPISLAPLEFEEAVRALFGVSENRQEAKSDHRKRDD